MPSKLEESKMREFFSSLYAKGVIATKVDYDKAVHRLVANIGGNTATADQALQSLMANYVVANSNSVQEIKQRWTWLAGIKQQAIAEFAKTFPSANVDDLIKAGKKAGYEVTVLRK